MITEVRGSPHERSAAAIHADDFTFSEKFTGHAVKQSNCGPGSDHAEKPKYEYDQDNCS
jgi:hypothetical protein